MSSELQAADQRDKVDIRPLTPGMLSDWLEFFESRAFSDHAAWKSCYCLEGHLTRAENARLQDQELRRRKAAALISAGAMHGYVAVSDGLIVGWCNVNDRAAYPYLAELYATCAVPLDPEPCAAKAIFCLLVAPENRGRGIASALIDRVARDAALEGCLLLEAYPFADAALPFQDHGTQTMYERLGFSMAHDLGFMRIMRKPLA